MVHSRGFMLLAAALAAPTAHAAGYTLVDNYDSSNFFQSFQFFSAADPTNGFVKYVDNVTANKTGLAGYADGGIYLGMDHTNVQAQGRPSTRLSSNKAYTKGLFVADIAHMPAGTGPGGSCGLWPAFWMFGPSWPSSGEIDIIEGVNSQTTDAITLHTASGCTMTNTGSLGSSKLTSADCNAGNAGLGCGQSTTNTQGFGAGFNAIGGGVYATEWTAQAISVWFFPRGSAMAETLAPSGANASSAAAAAAAPDSSTFGQPTAKFVGGSGCDIDTHFANHNLVFNIAACGDWAGQVWAQDATCSKLAATCNDYVANNPAAFAEAYWLINSVKVYQQGAAAAAKPKRERVVRRFLA